MELDPLILSRIQFAFVVCFHAIFPVFTIGLASTIAGFEVLHFKTDSLIWQKGCQNGYNHGLEVDINPHC